LLDRLHWRSLLAKQPATLTHDSDTLVLALATLGGTTYNSNGPISDVPPKVAKASTSVSVSSVVVTNIIAPTFANVNTAYACLVLPSLKRTHGRMLSSNPSLSLRLNRCINNQNENLELQIKLGMKFSPGGFQILSLRLISKYFQSKNFQKFEQGAVL
jgi:hypothetical protein